MAVLKVPDQDWNALAEIGRVPSICALRRKWRIT